jgi:hypothetical protein
MTGETRRDETRRNASQRLSSQSGRTLWDLPGCARSCGGGGGLGSCQGQAGEPPVVLLLRLLPHPRAGVRLGVNQDEALVGHCPAGNRQKGLVSALCARTKTPHKPDLLWRTQRAPSRPVRARDGRAGCRSESPSRCSTAPPTRCATRSRSATPPPPPAVALSTLQRVAESGVGRRGLGKIPRRRPESPLPPHPLWLRCNRNGCRWWCSRWGRGGPIVHVQRLEAHGLEALDEVLARVEDA